MIKAKTLKRGYFSFAFLVKLTYFITYSKDNLKIPSNVRTLVSNFVLQKSFAVC